MTRLLQMMLDELDRRNYAQNTKRCYLHAVADFAQHFHRSPDQLGLDHVRDYQVHLFRNRRLKANSVRAYLEALRFVFTAVLKRPWTVLDTPYHRLRDHHVHRARTGWPIPRGGPSWASSGSLPQRPTDSIGSHSGGTFRDSVSPSTSILPSPVAVQP